MRIRFTFPCIALIAFLATVSSVRAQQASPENLRQLAQLERQIAELEGLLISGPPLNTGSAAREAQLSQLGEQVAQLEALLKLSAPVEQPAKTEIPLAVLERRIEKLESRLATPPAVQESLPPQLPTRRRIVLPVRTKPEPPTRPAAPAPPPPRIPDDSANQTTEPQGPDQSTRRRVVLPPTSRLLPVKSSPSSTGTAFCATLRLKSKPALAGPPAPTGPNLFGVFEYEVLEVIRGGPAPSPTIRVAHGIRWGGKETSVMNREIGSEIAMDVVPLWWYPNLKKIDRLAGGDFRDDEAVYTPRLH